MYIDRKITPILCELKDQFPVLGVLGPRQSGKTTLVKQVFPSYKYINLEEPDVRRFAIEDPKRFLSNLLEEDGCILDEVQRAPELLSYIQSYVDTYGRPGFFILTGSENILLNEKINQSLAGRIALITLLPLSIEELKGAHALPTDVDTAILQGFYPSIYSKKIPAQRWIQNYVQTYVERDIRNMKHINDLSVFQKFLSLCAGRIGQLVDLTSLGNDCGVSAHTIRSWLSILEATYIVFLIRPHQKNFSKRVIKTPKLYFYDTAIACHLLSISSEKDLSTHYLRGGLFESMILSDIIKQRFHAGRLSNLYFWRDKSGLELDGILENGSSLVPIEIKSGETINSDFFANLMKWNKISSTPPDNNFLVYGGRDDQHRMQGSVLSWKSIDKLPTQ